MNVLGRLALFFVIVPILELMLLIQIGQYVGLWPTLLLVVFTGVAGAALARAEGMRVFFSFQKELASGRLPGQSILDGISVLIGGAFLLTPGVLTDFAGFSLLVPFTRRWIQKRVRARLEEKIKEGSINMMVMGPGGFASAGGFGQAGQTGQPDGPTMHPWPGTAGEPEPDPDAARPLDPSLGIDVEPK